MSLKSKIEAVIYASEEPVTLVQLIGLLSEEAQAELDAIAAQQAELALDGSAAAAPETSSERADERIDGLTAAEDAADDESTPAPDADALNAEVLEPSETTEELEGEPSSAEAEGAEVEEPGEADPAGDAEATEDAAEAAVVDEMADEIEAASSDEPAGEEAGDDEIVEVQEAGTEIGHEVSPESELEADTEAPDAEPVAAAASHEVPAPLAELRQTTVEEDEAYAKAWARAKERELRNYLRSLCDELIAEYANSDRGIEIREVAGGFRFSTKPEYHDAVRGFIKSLKPPMKLSLQALETLAVVAYKQPITAPEISEIRGVDSGGVVGSLIARKLVTTAGRKQVIGRPILYKTTKDFLVRFGLKDINELPSIEEFEKMAGELADMEPTQEEIPMDVVGEAEAEDMAALREAAEDAEPMAEEHEAQADGVPDGDEPASEAAKAGEDPEDFNVDADVDVAIDADLKPFEHSERPAEGADEDSGEEAVEDSDAEAEADVEAEERVEEESAPTDVDEILVDGRIAGIEGDAAEEDPSEAEAEIQAEEEGAE